MKVKKFTLLLAFFLIAARTMAFTDDFQAYANTQSQLMQIAYEKRDVKTYGKLLSDFEVKYNTLKQPEKKQYAGYLFNGYYNYCCAYALINNKVLALEYLDKSIKAGYKDYKHISEDTDLDNIRSEPGYIAQMTALRSVTDYMYIIKKAGAYNTTEKRDLPVFTYQDASNPNLVALRKSLNLDSIAGTGTDVSKVINLMYWIHNLVPHDGNHDNPVVRNAISMITVCKQEKRGLNCRGLAIVLNECYLSLGFKSRFVTCLPKDSLKIDNDCHVINTVYIPSLKKWIWIDPTFCAYVMNDKGELLGIAEVREGIITNKPLIINPDANWNHRATEPKEAYLYNYMAKNLYHLECPVNSEYDYETRTKGKTGTYVSLLPLEYFKQTPERSESVNPTTQYKFISYNSNNPLTFWAKP